ncbi:MAG: HEAT repeat domain-containing protein [Planctomycetaceae bacterium]
MFGQSECDDLRTIDELVGSALSETREESSWQAVSVLHRRGTGEVLEHAKRLSASCSNRERRLGADILGQLGVPDRTFPAECSAILCGMLSVEEDAQVLASILIALSFQNCSDAISLVTRFSEHSDPAVRHAVVLALASAECPDAITSLVRLSRDVDDNVRDWATFALGTLFESDTPQIRDALFDRIADGHDDTRGEALLGLARRKDSRVVDALIAELGSDHVGTLAIEAAEALASPALCQHLLRLRPWWDVDPQLLARAIAVCS